MRRFCVVSYDTDEQAWHYDFVIAASPEKAKARILAIRDYCVDADAIPLHELTRMARNLRKATKASTEKWLRELAAEREPLDSTTIKHKADCHIPHGSADCSCMP